MSLFIFVMLRLLPADIVDLLTSGDLPGSPETKQKLREVFGLADPIPVQYVKWVWGLLHLDPGHSMRSGEPVADILLRSLPITLELTAIAVVVAAAIAVPLGVLSAVKRGTGWDVAARLGGLIGLSVPNFWLATLALLFTSVQLHWVPPFFWISPRIDLAANLKQMAHPVLAIAVQLIAIVMRLTRATMLEVLREDYVRTARAKGLNDRAVTYRHALRNALIPVVSVIGFQIGALMGGSVVVETIFGLNGIGNTLVQAIFGRDYPVVQAASLFLATVFVLVNLVVDVLYVYLDPRIRHT
jgi:peptide/nickel transport system permease protein